MQIRLFLRTEIVSFRKAKPARVSQPADFHVQLPFRRHNGNLVIKTGVAGSLDGTVYLVGKPFFNPANQMIQMKDLDFALDTKSRLAKAAGWLAHGNLAKRMQESFRIPVGGQLETDRKSTRLNSSHSTLSRMPSSA